MFIYILPIYYGDIRKQYKYIIGISAGTDAAQ